MLFRSGLVPFLGSEIILLGGIFGILAVISSYLILGNYLKNVFRYDFRIPYLLSATLATFPPLLLFFFGIRQFVGVMIFVGALIGLLEGVAIVLMHEKSKSEGDREPEYKVRLPKVVPLALLVIFCFGALAEILF